MIQLSLCYHSKSLRRQIIIEQIKNIFNRKHVLNDSIEASRIIDRRRDQDGDIFKVKYWLWQPKAKESLYLMPGEVIMLQHDGRWTTAKLESRRTVY